MCDNVEEGEVYKSLTLSIHILVLCPFFTQRLRQPGNSGAMAEFNNEDGDGVNPGHLCQVSMGWVSPASFPSPVNRIFVSPPFPRQEGGNRAVPCSALK